MPVASFLLYPFYLPQGGEWIRGILPGMEWLRIWLFKIRGHL